MEGNVLFIDALITFLLTVQTYGKEPLRGPKSRGPLPSSKIYIYIYIYIYIIYRHVGGGGGGANIRNEGPQIILAQGPLKP